MMGRKWKGFLLPWLSSKCLFVKEHSSNRQNGNKAKNEENVHDKQLGQD